MAFREIYVYTDWQELGEARFTGTLITEQLRGKKVISFKYDKTWLVVLTSK